MDVVIDDNLIEARPKFKGQFWITEVQVWNAVKVKFPSVDRTQK